MDNEILTPEELEIGQQPVGCRYVFGDPGHGPWCYCQQTLAPGHALGNLAKPPYCAEHLAQVFETETEAQRQKRIKYMLRLAEGDEYHPENVPQWVELCGGTMPVDMYVKHAYTPTKKGFSHD